MNMIMQTKKWEKKKKKKKQTKEEMSPVKTTVEDNTFPPDMAGTLKRFTSVSPSSKL